MKFHPSLSLLSSLAVGSLALACSASSGSTPNDSEGGSRGGAGNGGTPNTNGGTNNAQGGASNASGGTSNSNGGQSSGSGGSTNGGNANGGTSNGGSTASGGASNGGTSTGGMPSGGNTSSSKGGAGGVAGNTGKGGTTGTGGATSNGGTSMGGKASGGTTSSGGTASGGTASGGTASGGTASGGSSMGGSGNDRCDVGVYDSANPPKVLTLSGNLGSHDPSTIIESNGTYYLFQTGLGAKTSTNLTNWQAAPRPFTAPAWATMQVPGVTDLWAPDIAYFGGQYHLYYSASTFGSNRSCIGHATRAALNTGSWTDQGQVICSNVGTNDNWNAIDPNIIIDTSNTPWMAFGSFWSGIKIIQLNQSGGRVGTTVTALANRPSNGGALEGPFMVRRCGYYYLFVSWDTCCKGADSTYNIRVGRSTSVTGPFTDKAGTAMTNGGGTLVAQRGGSWAGPGGQSVAIIGNKAYLVYHAYATSNGAATLRIADLVWDSSGWPVAVGP